jgi:hypothetical protein
VLALDDAGAAVGRHVSQVDSAVTAGPERFEGDVPLRLQEVADHSSKSWLESDLKSYRGIRCTFAQA